MPKGASKLVFKCPKCDTKQQVQNENGRSHTCIDCETVYAIVNDGEGNKALVEYFNQK